MDTNNIRLNLAQKLSSIMSLSEAYSELDFVIKEHLNINKVDLILNPNILLAHVPTLDDIVNIRLNSRKPLQYILNKALFLNDIYYVDESTLIPRPETEILVSETLKYLDSSSKILEIGTGSGCIAISLAKLLKNDSITACDISKSALNVALKNAKNICPKRNINFIESDLFSNISGKFDAIISNPPYIDFDLKKDMQPEVLDFEPHNALFAENNGMFFYGKIIENVHNFLNKGGFVAFEVGVKQAEKIEKMLYFNGFSKVIIVTDLSSIDRVVLGMYN